MKLRCLRKVFRDDEAGATAVEMALCLPLILLMFFGCFRYGIFFFNATEINRSVDQSTRKIVLLHQPTVSEIEAIISDELTDKYGQDLTYSVSLVERYGETFADISMDYTFSFDMPFLENFDLNSSYQNLVLLSDFEDGTLANAQG